MINIIKLIKNASDKKIAENKMKLMDRVNDAIDFDKPYRELTCDARCGGKPLDSIEEDIIYMNNLFNDK